MFILFFFISCRAAVRLKPLTSAVSVPCPALPCPAQQLSLCLAQLYPATHRQNLNQATLATVLQLIVLQYVLLLAVLFNPPPDTGWRVVCVVFCLIYVLNLLFTLWVRAFCPCTSLSVNCAAMPKCLCTSATKPNFFSIYHAIAKLLRQLNYRNNINYTKCAGVRM